MIKKLDQNGFTIIELLIATSVFTAVLFIVTYGVIQISKTYTNGFIRGQTQNIAVSLSDTMTRDIEFSTTASITTDQSAQVTKTGSQATIYYYFCTTQNEYFYIPGGNIYKIPIVSLQGVLGSQNCFSPQQFINNSGLSADTQSLLSPNNVEILNHTVYDNQSMLSNVSSGLYSVNIEILYGNQSNLVQNNNGSQWICRPTVLIGPFCAIYSFSTQAYTQN